jgi:hypothetical protein
VTHDSATMCWEWELGQTPNGLQCGGIGPTKLARKKGKRGNGFGHTDAG